MTNNPPSINPHTLIPAHFAHEIVMREPEGFMSGDDWLMDLPKLLRTLFDIWELEPAGTTMSGQCAIAIPVRGAHLEASVLGAASEAILKVGWPHEEATLEHLALAEWQGQGAVQLLKAEPTHFAMLLERAHHRDLNRVPIDKACEVIGTTLRALARPAHARFQPLKLWALRWAEELTATEPLLPRRYLDQAARFARDLTESGAQRTLLHTDLHFENILSSDRGWLAIDPKPLAGDPAFEVAPALWNRADELGQERSVREDLRRRLEIICEAAGIDEERARAWTVVREAINAMWATGEPGGEDRVSLAVTIIKAMND